LCTAGSTSAAAASIGFVHGTGPVRGTGTGDWAATAGRGVSSGRIRSDDVLPGSGTDAAVNGSGDACATFGPGWVLVGELEPRAALDGEEG
jgi:hypothetical protein